MTQYELNPDIFRTIETQIIQNDPPCARLTFNQLMELGCSQMETLELIGGVFVQHMNNVMMFGNKFDEADYALQLESLVKNCEVQEVKEVVLDEILTEKHAGYDALMEENADAMVAHWMKGVELIKELAAKEFPEGKPELAAVDQKTEFKYGIMNWMGDMERELGTTGKHEDRVTFCKDMMESFAWSDAAVAGFKAAIGEAYCAMGQVEACKEWFDAWLQEEPGNPVAVNSYLYSLVEFKEMDLAKELAETQIDDSMECDLDTETLFYRAQTLFEAAGNMEKAEVYRKKIADFHSKCLGYAKAYEAGEKAKIYPNDLCPCGSGKKYKKCCGK